MGPFGMPYSATVSKVSPLDPLGTIGGKLLGVKQLVSDINEIEIETFSYEINEIGFQDSEHYPTFTHTCNHSLLGISNHLQSGVFVARALLSSAI